MPSGSFPWGRTDDGYATNRPGRRPARQGHVAIARCWPVYRRTQRRRVWPMRMAIQDAVTAGLGKPVGAFKAMAPANGEPTRGVIYADTIHASPARVPAAEVPQCGVEGEVAFIFRRDLPATRRHPIRARRWPPRWKPARRSNWSPAAIAIQMPRRTWKSWRTASATVRSCMPHRSARGAAWNSAS